MTFGVLLTGKGSNLDAAKELEASAMVPVISH